MTSLNETFNNHIDTRLSQLIKTREWLNSPGVAFLFLDLDKALQEGTLVPYTFQEHYGPYISIAIPDMKDDTDPRLLRLLSAIGKHDPQRSESYDVPMRSSRMYEFAWHGPDRQGFRPLLTIAIEAITRPA